MGKRFYLYIPREIRNCALETRTVKKNQYRVVYNKMVSLYSRYSITDYYRMVNHILLQTPESEKPIENLSSYLDTQEDKWIEIIDKDIKRFFGDEDGYSKIILVLTILEQIPSESVIHNRFYLPICESYNAIWRKNKPKSIHSIPNFYKVIITLKESTFYYIKKVEGGFLDIKGRERKIWDKETALNYIDYGYLNEELFDLLHRDSFRNKLHHLISVYILAFDKTT